MDMFSYDKEIFSNMNIKEKHNFIKSFINRLANRLNDEKLIDTDKAPNENIIYHLYSDGTITRQKGSWAYGKRTIFEIKSKCLGQNKYFKFPIESIIEGDTYSIMTEENCNKIRCLMDELLLQV